MYAQLAVERNVFGSRLITKTKGHAAKPMPIWDGISRDWSAKGRAKVRSAAQFIQDLANSDNSSYYWQHSKRGGGSAARSAPIFVTLTFKERQKSHKEAKSALNSWLTYLRRHRPNIYYVWTAELQKDGTIHFHLIFSKRIPKKIILAWSRRHGRVDAQAVKWSAKGYLTKYITKSGAEAPDVIKGFRYGISRNFHNLAKWQILQNYTFPIELFDEACHFISDYADFEHGSTKILLGSISTDYGPILDEFVFCFPDCQKN